MKEVNFSFFTSVRFLGLGLKILFHKNKEIKRMLSKKMAFSLMSLITILALAFVAPFAMAGDFGVALDKTDDISTATDDLELVHPGDGMKITLRVEFAKAVILAKEGVQIVTLDKDGKLLSLQKFPAAAETAANAGQTKSFSPVIEGTATTVKLFIVAGTASADPFNADTSAKLEATIHLIGADDGPPTVYSIERAFDDDHAFAKISPKTDPTIEVRITLSELPKAFTKDHISVTEATVTSVRQLLTESGTTLSEFLASDDAPDSLPPMRMLLDGTIPTTAVNPTAPDLEVYVDATTGNNATPRTLEPLNKNDATDSLALRTAKVTAREAYGGMHRAINESSILATAHQYDMLSVRAASDASVPYTVTAKANLMGLPTYTGEASTAVPKKLKAKLEADTPVTTVVVSADGATSRDLVPDVVIVKGTDISSAPTAPDPTGFPNVALYEDAVDHYTALLSEYVKYANALAMYNAYTVAVAIEEGVDLEAGAEAYADLDDVDVVRFTTGTDEMLYPYLVTLTPKYANTNNVVVKVKEFEDLTRPTSEKYIPPSLESAYREGVDKLTILVAEAKTADALAAGTRVNLPHGDPVAQIPASGFYILTKDNDGSGINFSVPANENKAHLQTPAQLKYNVRAGALPNLESFLNNNGTIHLVAYDGTAATAAYISEVMWGSDASQEDSSKSQWIEIANTTASAITVAEAKWALWFYQAHETPAASYTDTDGTTAGTIIDSIGTKSSGTGVFWSVVGKGRGGRTNVDPGGADVVAIAPTQSLISMSRVADATGVPADGTLPASWAASQAPSVNFTLGIEGTRVANPGASAIARPTAPTPPPVTPKVAVAAASDIMITEIMVDTDNGRLPQWIELTHSGTGEVSLDGWEMVIANAIDADVLGGW